MMTNGDSSDKKKALSQLDFTNLVLQWSLQDILNENLYKNQVYVFRGHTNEKNFVGLTVNSGYVDCSSETNQVFVYQKAITRGRGFGSTHLEETFEDASSSFMLED